MRFQRLDIQNVRNLASVSIELAGGLNFFRGNNGAGKTALLEALHILCRGRSFPTAKIQPLISHGSEELIVRARGLDEWRGEVTLAVRKDRQLKTELRIDGAQEKRMSEIARLTPLQVMLPDVAELVFGAPGERRRWLDWGTFHVKHDYLITLRECLRVLKQRNALLRDGAAADRLAPWTRQFVELAQTVTGQRRDYLQRLSPHFDKTLATLAPGLQITVDYVCGWSEEAGLEKVLGESLGRELKFGATQSGPHRADVVLTHETKAVAGVLSRGQAKIVASALLISQAALLAETQQRSTVFLIDDLGAELDIDHGRRLLTLLRDTGAQILATGTTPPPQELQLAALFSADGGPPRMLARDSAVEAAIPAGFTGAQAPAQAPDVGSGQEFRMFHVKQGVVQRERGERPTGD
ncbi:MAG: DNA replication/repair protein RecF [Pseudomonadales bacterium]|nr:DNA replication/repair protein RecF [Pseudomonadales bacterium]